MKFLSAMAIIVTTGIWLTAVAAAPSGVPAAVKYISHEQFAASIAKGGPLIQDPGLNIITQHRGAGAVEYHEHTNHIFMVMGGEATVIAGGTLIDPRPGGPGQMRASGIDGGQTYHLTKGDVMTIPAKTPHWWKEVPSQTVDLYTVNIEN